jgi:hypothetical protein
MKYVLFALLAIGIFTAGFFAGEYKASSSIDGPALNKRSAQNDAHNDIASDMSKDTNIADSHHCDDVMPSSNHAQHQRNEQDASISNIAVDIASPEISLDGVASNEVKYPLAQQELVQWAKRHKTELKRAMTEHMGEQSAEMMFEQILKNNDFLNDPIAEHSIEEDLGTRQDIEQAIEDYLMVNSSDPEMTILDVICMQGRCEITLAAQDQVALVRLHMSLTNNGVPGVSGTSAPTIFMMPEGGVWAYMLVQYH